MHKINKTELRGVRHSQDERWHPVYWIYSGIFLLILCFQTMFWPFFIQTADWQLWLSCTKPALIFSSPGALLLQKQTHLMSPQLPLANSPAVKKNQAEMWWDLVLPEHVIYFCDKAQREAGPTLYYIWKGHLTPLYLDINYIYFSKSKPPCKTLLCAMHSVVLAAFLKVNLLV